MTAESLIAIVAGIGGTLNIIFMAANLWMMTNIKLAVQEIRTEIANNRRADQNELRAWVEERLQQYRRTSSAAAGH